MKKILIALLLLGTIFANSFAQEYDVVEVGEEVSKNKDEVYVTIGTFSGIGMFFLIIGGVSNDKKGGDDSLPLPSFTAGYNHFFNDHFGLGGFLSYEYYYGLSFITTQAKIIGQYGWEHFKLYHSLSAGLSITPGNGMASVLPGVDATILGLKLDFDNWNIFLEACFPETGYLKVGGSYKF